MPYFYNYAESIEYGKGEKFEPLNEDKNMLAPTCATNRISRKTKDDKNNCFMESSAIAK